MTDRLDDYQSHREYRSHTARPNWQRIATTIATLFAAMKVSTIVLAHHQHWSAWLLFAAVWWMWYRAV